MKIKWNNKKYCVSPCAKDKFERFIIRPISVVLTGIAILVTLSFIGMITDGILIVFFNCQSAYRTGEWLLLGLVDVLVLIIVVTTTQVVFELLGHAKSLIEYRMSTAYHNRYKPECKLFVECTDTQA